MPGHQDTVFYPFDLTKAKADFDAGLQEAGVASASDLKLQIGYNTGANWENKVDFMVEAWRTAFGVSVEPVGLEWGAYLDRLSKDPFTIFRLGWGADYPHPNNFLTDLISCTSANNYMGYCNKDVDALCWRRQPPSRRSTSRFPCTTRRRRWSWPMPRSSRSASDSASSHQAVGPEPEPDGAGLPDLW